MFIINELKTFIGVARESAPRADCIQCYLVKLLPSDSLNLPIYQFLIMVGLPVTYPKTEREQLLFQSPNLEKTKLPI